ncbi:MAG TPA: hypothetical protein VKS98_11110 [Chthoniobacterales bacterium]|nr:hypothetical protein [Chthoniobacterales bacterium]
MRWRFYLHLGLWSALFVVLIWISAPIVGSAVMENRVGPAETNRSIDSYLSVLTKVDRASDKFSDAFQGLGKEGRLIIFTRDGNPQSEFLGMIMAYISWPREVQLIKVPGDTVDKELVDIKPGMVAGVLFCSVNPPPWLENRVKLGSRIILVPVTRASP